jgi:hypothetical protein
LLVGSLLSLVPMVASFPSARLVVPASIGVSAAWAVVILHAVRHLRASMVPDPRNFSPLAAAVLVGIAFFQVWHASNRSMNEVRGRAYFHRSVRQWVLEAEIDDRRVTRQDIFYVNGLEHTLAVFSTFIRYFHGHPMPRSCRILSAAPRAHDIERTAENVLEISVLGGSMLSSDLEKLYRADRFPLNAADTVQLEGMKVEIVKLLRGKPFHVRFTFDKPLEDPSYLFLHSSEKGLRKFDLPDIGERVRIPKAQFPDELLLNVKKMRARKLRARTLRALRKSSRKLPDNTNKDN